MNKATAAALVLCLSWALAIPGFADLDDLDELDRDKDSTSILGPPSQPKKVPVLKNKGSHSADSALEDEIDQSVQRRPRTKVEEQEAPDPKQPLEQAEPKKSQPKKKDPRNASSEINEAEEPIRFWSKDMLAQRANGIIELKKDVIIIQGDTEMKSDYAKIYTDIDSNTVIKAEAVGRVRLNKESEDPSERMVAKSDRAWLYYRERKMVLINNASILKEGSLLKGKRITYDMETGWITFDSAEGIMQPGENQ